MLRFLICDFGNLFYSVLRAVTGSFLAAILAGINPAIKVRNILINTKMTPPFTGSAASPQISVMAATIALMGIKRSKNGNTYYL